MSRIDHFDKPSVPLIDWVKLLMNETVLTERHRTHTQFTPEVNPDVLYRISGKQFSKEIPQRFNIILRTLWLNPKLCAELIGCILEISEKRKKNNNLKDFENVFIKNIMVESQKILSNAKLYCRRSHKKNISKNIESFFVDFICRLHNRFSMKILKCLFETNFPEGFLRICFTRPHHKRLRDNLARLYAENPHQFTIYTRFYSSDFFDDLLRIVNPLNQIQSSESRSKTSSPVLLPLQPELSFIPLPYHYLPIFLSPGNYSLDVVTEIKTNYEPLASVYNCASMAFPKKGFSIKQSSMPMESVINTAVHKSAGSPTVHNDFIKKIASDLTFLMKVTNNLININKELSDANEKIKDSISETEKCIQKNSNELEFLKSSFEKLKNTQRKATYASQILQQKIIHLEAGTLASIALAAADEKNLLIETAPSEEFKIDFSQTHLHGELENENTVNLFSSQQTKFSLANYNTHTPEEKIVLLKEQHVFLMERNADLKKVEVSKSATQELQQSHLKILTKNIKNLKAQLEKSLNHIADLEYEIDQLLKNEAALYEQQGTQDQKLSSKPSATVAPLLSSFVSFKLFPHKHQESQKSSGQYSSRDLDESKASIKSSVVAKSIYQFSLG